MPRPAAAVLLAGPTVLAFFSGGYDVEPQMLGAAVAFCTLGLLIAASPWPPIRGAGLLALVGLAGLAAWTGASISWAPIRDLAANETVQLTLYATVFAGALVAMRDPAASRWAAPALLAGTVIVAIYALAGRLLPDLFPTELSLRAGSRIQQPLTYWNALGLLMTLGVLLGISVSADRHQAFRLRVAACASTVPCALVLFLTFSRGSLVALAAGYVALLLARPSRAALLAGALALASGAVLAALLRLFPAVLELGRESSEQTAQGAAVAAALVAVTLAVGAAFARIVARGGFASTLNLGPRARTAIAGLSVVAVVGLGWLVADSSERTEPLSSSKERLTTITTNRGAYWRVALDALADDPLTGAGAGSFMVEWRRERTSDEFALDAHSLYIETLGELGLVGGVLLAVFLIPALAGLAGSGGGGLPDSLRWSAAACLTAFLVHVALDWTWEFPAVTLIPLLLVAGVLASPTSPSPAGADERGGRTRRSDDGTNRAAAGRVGTPDSVAG